MEILSVNLATRSTLTIKGREVDTGIFKRSVPGLQRVSTYGLEGDVRVDARQQFGEAHHAVYAYPHEHYGPWEQHLGRGPLPYGQFGENLTTLGLLEAEVRIGDILRAGSAVLQVAHPRIPCRKLNACMEHNFARAFLESRRLGFYLRVLESGALQAGDALTLLDRDLASPSMDDFIRISQLDYWDVEGLESLLRARALVPGWRDILEEKLARARGAAGWFGHRELEVTAREEEGDGVYSYRLRCARGRALPRPAGGQRLLVSSFDAEVRGTTRLACALSGDPSDTTSYRITTDHPALAHLVVGARLQATAPHGRFTLALAAPGTTPLLLLSAGVGLAPLLALLRPRLREGDAPETVLFHDPSLGCPQGLWRELEQLAAVHPPLQLRRAALSIDALAALPMGPRASAFVAGPRAFVDAAAAALRTLAMDSARLHSDVL